MPQIVACICLAVFLLGLGFLGMSATPTARPSHLEHLEEMARKRRAQKRALALWSGRWPSGRT